MGNNNNILALIISTIKSKIMPIWIKFKLWTSITFLKTRVFTYLRKFFKDLLNVKPRNQNDYYTFFGWLVSKRLAIAAVVVLGVGSVFYVYTMMPTTFNRNTTTTLRSYKYRSIPLKFLSDRVEIIAHDGHVAYVGMVSNGAANGDGSVYNSDNVLVYNGNFAKSMYSGQGTLYYPNGAVEYKGEFADNLFNGTGFYYRDNGILEYNGDYVEGDRTGLGTLYNQVGKKVFNGSFIKNQLVYNEFLGKTTPELSDIYTGASLIYSSDNEYCVAMSEINAVYSIADGSNTLENEWLVDSVIVPSDTIPLEGNTYSTIKELRGILGQPLYSGTSYVKLPEAVAINMLTQQKNLRESLTPVKIDTTSEFDTVFNVNSYDTTSLVYLYTFQRNGLLYTFYCSGANQTNFLMYSIAVA